MVRRRVAFCQVGLGVEECTVLRTLRAMWIVLGWILLSERYLGSVYAFSCME